MNCQAALLLAKANADPGSSSGAVSGSAQNESQDKEALLTRVVELLNRASEVDPQDTTTLVVRGKLQGGGGSISAF